MQVRHTRSSSSGSRTRQPQHDFRAGVFGVPSLACPRPHNKASAATSTSHNTHLGAALRLALSTTLFRARWSWNISLPFIHHTRRSPRVRLAVLHVTTPSLPQRIERVWPANTRGHRRRLCLPDSYTYTHVFGARVLSAASPTRRWCTLSGTLLMPSNSASKHDLYTPIHPTSYSNDYPYRP